VKLSQKSSVDNNIFQRTGLAELEHSRRKGGAATSYRRFARFSLASLLSFVADERYD